MIYCVKFFLLFFDIDSLYSFNINKEVLRE